VDQLGPNALGDVLAPGRVADCYLGLLLPPGPAGELEAGTTELRAWPQDTWAKVGVDPDQVAQAVIGCWQDEQVTGLQVDDLGLEEARSLTRPAMTYVRGQLRGRLTARLARAHWRWLHPTSGRHPDDRFP
jgi:hypothetical protein